MVPINDDLRWMARALALGLRGAPGAAPNPAVGAVVVRRGKAIGEGWTQPPGGPHAEIVALRRAGRRARRATLYVSLEPCCHFARTGPCTEAILRAGIRRVVAATKDPHPAVAGGGFARLRRAGIRVTSGVLEAAAREAHQPFFKWVRTGIPYVILKVAATLDGKTATASGESRWITCEASRRLVHTWRSETGAVLVGSGTVLLDNPRLTARDARGTLLARQPLRIVLDGRGRTPPKAKIFDRSAGTMVAVVGNPPPSKVRAWARRGAEVYLDRSHRGRVDLRSLLSHLGLRGVTQVLVEGGAETHAEFLREGLVDAVRWFVAPKILGGNDAKTSVGGASPLRLQDAQELKITSLRPVGKDWLFEGVFRQY